MNETIGSRVVKLRKLKGWTQGQLAKRASLTQQAISHVETGRRADPRTLSRIAEALDVPEAFLRYGPDELGTLDEQTIDIAMRIAKLSPEDRAKIGGLLDLIDGK